MTGAEAVQAYQARFKTPPYAHQRADAAKLFDETFFGLFAEMGTGKSKIVVDAACMLASEEQIDAVLVICPAAVRSVWVNPEFGEIRKHSWLKSTVVEFHNPVRVIWSEGENESGGLCWLVTNYELLRREKHREKLKKLLHGFKVLMVLDESSFIKSRQAAQTKACLELGKLAARRVILNGTPISNSPLDLWSQLGFLSPRILPYKNFYHFRSEFAVMGGWQNHQVVHWKHLDHLQELAAPHVVRREKKDCLDLPPKIYLTPVEVPLTPETWARYKQMRDEAIVWLDEHPSLAAQAGVRVMRLCQLTSGFIGGVVETEEALDEAQTRELSREKLDFLTQWVRERLDEKPSLKLIVWCRFRAELERVARELTTLLPTYRLYGGQSGKERATAIAAFSSVDCRGPALLAAQPHAGGLGLNLVGADTVVYLSNDFSLMSRLQSEDRAHRSGQTRPVTYLDVLATGPDGQKSVDHHIVKTLRSKHDLATWTVRAWKEALGD